MSEKTGAKAKKAGRRCTYCGERLADDEGTESALYRGLLCDGCADLEPKTLRASRAVELAAARIEELPGGRWAEMLVYFLETMEREARGEPTPRAHYLGALESVQAAIGERLAGRHW